jgi:hypothetical protein
MDKETIARDPTAAYVAKNGLPSEADRGAVPGIGEAPTGSRGAA